MDVGMNHFDRYNQERFSKRKTRASFRNQMAS